MKRCPNCNYQNGDANMYCERCGTFLAAPGEAALSDQTYASTNGVYGAPLEHTQTTQEQQPYYSAAPLPPPPVRNVYQEVYREVPPPPPTPYAAIASPIYGYGSAQMEMSTPVPRQRSLAATLLSSLLYLIGAFCFAFGLAGFILYHTSSTLIGSVFIIISVIALIALVLLLIFRKHLVLKWWVRVLAILGLTIAGGGALFAIAAINGSMLDYNYTSFGFIFIIYGMLTAIIAFW